MSASETDLRHNHQAAVATTEGGGGGSVVASRRERLRRPLPNPPMDRGSTGAAAAAAAAGVRGVVASRLEAMASAGSTSSSSTSASASVINGGSNSGIGSLNGGNSGGEMSSSTSSSTTSSSVTSTANPKLSATSYSLDSNSRIPSYRLSSLDRLAQRQRLFESSSSMAGTAPPPPPPSSTSSIVTAIVTTPATLASNPPPPSSSSNSTPPTFTTFAPAPLPAQPNGTHAASDLTSAVTANASSLYAVSSLFYSLSVTCLFAHQSDAIHPSGDAMQCNPLRFRVIRPADSSRSHVTEPITLYVYNFCL